MSAQLINNDKLFELLQNVYFDAIDNADADSAVEAFNDDAMWIHTQVWEHDGHNRSTVDKLHGKDNIREFLSRRIGEMQVVGIKHRVKQIVCIDDSGAFRAEVYGRNEKALPFFGWVELKDNKISKYIVHPEQ